MKSIGASAFTAALAAVLVSAVAVPALANFDAVVLRQKVMRLTPQCDRHPDYPVVGRVVGNVGWRQPTTVSFVGCFPDYRACERWAGPVSSLIWGRLIRADCGPRF